MLEVINNNIPKLRFPEFKGEWEKKKFEDVFVFSTGKNIKQNEASPEFATPCVRYGELYHMYNEVINEVINKTNLDKSELLLSEGVEILLPSAGEDPLDIGSASALTLKNVAIGRTINILKPVKENFYNQIYVAYYINHRLKKDISKLAKGVSISNVYNSDLKALSLNLTSLSEQTRIASFFTVIDKKISELKQKKALLEQYKKGVMQRLFSYELGVINDEFNSSTPLITPNSKLKTPLRFKDENGKDFSDWEKKKFGEVAFKNSSNIAANAIEDNFGDYIIYGASGVLKKVDFFREEGEYISIVKDGAGVGRVFLCAEKSSVLGTLDIIKPIEGNLHYLFY